MPLTLTPAAAGQGADDHQARWRCLVSSRARCLAVARLRRLSPKQPPRNSISAGKTSRRTISRCSRSRTGSHWSRSRRRCRSSVSLRSRCCRRRSRSRSRSSASVTPASSRTFAQGIICTGSRRMADVVGDVGDDHDKRSRKRTVSARWSTPNASCRNDSDQPHDAVPAGARWIVSAGTGDHAAQEIVVSRRDHWLAEGAARSRQRAVEGNPAQGRKNEKDEGVGHKRIGGRVGRTTADNDPAIPPGDTRSKE